MVPEMAMARAISQVPRRMSFVMAAVCQARRPQAMLKRRHAPFFSSSC
jgi:hypothetical protein